MPTAQTPVTAEPAQSPEIPPERRTEETPGREGPMGKVVHLHTAHPRVPIPYLTPGDMFTGAREAAPRLPSMRKLTYYGILGGMAVAGVLEWPVAVAIAAATEVITREQGAQSRAGQAAESRPQPGTGPSARTEGARPQAATG
ncbi:hypothetical protein AB5J52_00905 [Streptomyces sp. R39]|uniref:Uncharacterized protein n=1 Tax=Streptomyces sp. R39 TaxID=3238631 RepID=A0AB39QEJ0_9ACTN